MILFPLYITGNINIMYQNKAGGARKEMTSCTMAFDVWHNAGIIKIPITDSHNTGVIGDG